MTAAPPIGAMIRLISLPNVTGRVFDTGELDGERVAYVALTGGTCAAFTLDRFELVP